ncbi:MAG: hypothetical protein J6I73_09240 [Treponema sp.]|nr:hypothetical protein [Treponema sp.]
MKAIIISDDESAIKKIDACLVDAGYSTIIYRWLLKALDNVEEIAPDVILINTCDYPRHWKTFAQYAKSSMPEKTPRVILYAPENFSGDEQKKADALGIAGVFHSCDDAGLQTLLAALGSDETHSAQHLAFDAAQESVQTAFNNDRTTAGDEIDGSARNGDKQMAESASESVRSEYAQTNGADEQAAFDSSGATAYGDSADENGQTSDSEQAERTEDDEAQSFAARATHTKSAAIFTHPATSAFVTGSASFQNDGMIEFTPDVPSLAEGLFPGDCIDELSYKRNGECSYATAEVVSSGLTILLKLGSEAA